MTWAHCPWAHIFPQRHLHGTMNTKCFTNLFILKRKPFMTTTDTKRKHYMGNYLLMIIQAYIITVVFHPSWTPNDITHIISWCWVTCTGGIAFLGIIGSVAIKQTVVKSRRHALNLNYLQRSCYFNPPALVALRWVLRLMSVVAFGWAGWESLCTLAVIVIGIEIIAMKTFRESIKEVQKNLVAKGLITWTELGWPEKEPETKRGDDLPFRAGDIVKHRPTSEEWMLACDEDDGRVYWAGHPFGGYGLANDCTLVRRATDEHRILVLKEVADEKRSVSISPVRLARAQLAGKGDISDE